MWLARGLCSCLRLFICAFAGEGAFNFCVCSRLSGFAGEGAGTTVSPTFRSWRAYRFLPMSGLLQVHYG